MLTLLKGLVFYQRRDATCLQAEAGLVCQGVKMVEILCLDDCCHDESDLTLLTSALPSQGDREEREKGKPVWAQPDLDPA